MTGEWGQVKIMWKKKYLFNTIFVSSHMYPENPEGTQVIVGSMNMGYISDTAMNRTLNLFHPKREPIPLGHSDGQVSSTQYLIFCNCYQIWCEMWRDCHCFHSRRKRDVTCLVCLVTPDVVGVVLHSDNNFQPITRFVSCSNTRQWDRSRCNLPKIRWKTRDLLSLRIIF